MNLTAIKKPSERFTTSYFSTLNIQSYGRDNLYPQRMFDLISNSPSGGTCLDRFETFIEGNGLNNTEFSEYICNRSGETIDDIYRLISQDIAIYHGFALHVNYNLVGKIVELQHIPFQNCRLEEEDENGVVNHIIVHPDWTGRKTRRGKNINVDKSNIASINTFSPKFNDVFNQIKEAGGIDKYKGQILWISMDGKWEYPKPIYDKIVTNLSTDEGLDNVKYRNVRNNFLLAGMLIHKKGINTSIDDDGNNNTYDEENDAISKSLESFQGDVNCCSIMDVALNSDEDKPTFTSFESSNFDSKFTCTETSTVERIYSAFGQEPWYCIRIGKLGFSGEVLQEAYEYYNSYVDRERRAITRALKRIFDNWFEDANKSKDYTVQPLIYIKNESNGLSDRD